MTDIAYEQLEQSLVTLGLTQTPSEYHGALCGMVCTGAPAAWDLGLATEHEGTPDPAARQLLTDLREQVDADFNDADMGFAPLLPDDDDPLLDRADALGEWCQGFLFGLASKDGLDLKALSEDAQEMITDITDISKASSASVGDDDGQPDQEDEAAYAELVEYVRVGAQMMFFEFRGNALSGSSADTTLH